MEDSLIPVNVVVGDRTYRVRIEPEHEEIVRKTVKVINDKLLEFKTSFAGKDMQDYIAMVVLWYATSAAEEGNEAGQGQGSSEQISALESILDKALS
jgi:cell division protein ZapA